MTRSATMHAGRLTRLWPLNKPLLRRVHATVGESLDRSLLRRWDDADPPYRPGNAGLATWVQSLVAAGPRSGDG